MNFNKKKGNSFEWEVKAQIHLIFLENLQRHLVLMYQNPQKIFFLSSHDIWALRILELPPQLHSIPSIVLFKRILLFLIMLQDFFKLGLFLNSL